MTQISELVTIGVPIRNAEYWIKDSLEQLINQTHKNIEIIISDNNSTDDTPNICKDYAARDKRIRYIRHNFTHGVAEHFRYVLNQAKSDYFMWAAHDDRHSSRYVEVLLEALLANQDASLAFSNVAIFNKVDEWQAAQRIPYAFDCDSQKRFWRGLYDRDYIRDGYLHFYGMIRRRSIEGYTWPFIELGGDRPLLMYLWCRGKFVWADGACFYCYKPEQKKSHEQRANYISGGGVRPFLYIRLNWICAQSVSVAEAYEGRRRNKYLIFGVLLIKEFFVKCKNIFYFRMLRMVSSLKNV